jgi:hypothetical protein
MRSPMVAAVAQYSRLSGYRAPNLTARADGPIRMPVIRPLAK